MSNDPAPENSNAVNDNDEPALVAAARAGSEPAFAALHARHGDAVRAYLYRMSGSREDAEDLSQEVWTRVFRRLGTFEARAGAGFRTWVFTVATRLAIDHHRARQRWPTDAQDRGKALGISGPETEAEFRRVEAEAPRVRFDLREHIDFCLTCIMKTLPLEQQIAVLLCDIHGFSNAEAATVLERSLGIVKHLLHDARNTLDRIFQHRCALINQRGICHQCSELNGVFNPAQDAQAAVARLDLARAAADGSVRGEELLTLRVALAREVDPLNAAGTDLHESIMGVVRRALAE